MDKVMVEVLKGVLKGQTFEAEKYEARVGTVYAFYVNGMRKQLIAKNVKEI